MTSIQSRALPAPSRRSHVPPFYVMEIYGAAEARRNAGLPVFNLAAGQPSAGAPSAVLSAARAALAEHRLGYTEALGLPPLREAIAAHYQWWYGLDVRPANVVVTTGSSGGFLLAFLASFDAADTVAMPRPGYPAYRNILASLGCRVVEFDGGPAANYQLSVASLDELDPVPQGLIIGSPANPTGSVIAAADLAAVARWCRARGTRLISDELYHGITYTGRAACAWEFGRDSVIVGSFSKYFAMTGWRLGWLLVPDELLDAVFRLTANYTICPPALSQYAALGAFDCYDELDGHVARYRQNRELVLGALPRIGLRRLAPADGAFYVYADVSDYTTDSLGWARRVLADTGVALAPGIDFDTAEGHGYARLSLAGDTQVIEHALEELDRYLKLA